ncbi:MAG: sulfotransferase [Actinomycetota bacterium]
MSGATGSAPTRVAYVGGWGRSGSTLLDRILGRVEGFVSVGELRMIWRRGLVGNATCGCGSAFRDCPFWIEVGDRAFGGWDQVDVDDVMRLRNSLDRGWSTLVLASPVLPGSWRARLARYESYLAPLYSSIADVAGASVVVDSSKLPSHAFILRRMDGVDPRVIHLVRDPRGVAYSWQKDVVKDPNTGEKMIVYRPWSAAARYDLYNAMTSFLRTAGVPYLRVRYEDLVAEPEATVRRIVTHVRPEDPLDLSFIDGGNVAMGVDHTVGGNPMRFSQGAMQIRRDESWRTELPAGDRRWVSALTAPWRARYGYPTRDIDVTQRPAP